MAGKRQHILPRSLLRGFASCVQGEKTFTWVYRKDKPCFETTIENVGLEKYFYGKTGEISADDVITDLEGGYASLINALRYRKDGDEVREPNVRELIAHLTIRTKQLREAFRNSTEYLLDQITTYLADASNLRRMLSRPGLIEAEIERQLRPYQIPSNERAFLVELAKAAAPGVLNEGVAGLQTTLIDSLHEIRKMLPTGISEGHIKALAKNPAPETRADTYKNLNWFIRETSEPLLLGDTGCLFETAAKRRFKPMDDMGDEIVNIYLPISAQKLLVGTVYANSSHVEFGQINESIANCSYEYFVCSASSPLNEKHGSTIGDWAGVLTQREIDELFTEIVADLERDPFGSSATRESSKGL